MVWVPPLGFDPYCEGKWLPLQDTHPKYQLENNFFTNVINEFLKIKKSNFLGNDLTDLDD